jgi:hypothetical protein
MRSLSTDILGKASLRFKLKKPLRAFAGKRRFMMMRVKAAFALTF